MHRAIDLEPEILIEAYCRGVFPMADSDGAIRWYTANPRGIIPLENFHIPKSLAQFMRSPNCPFELRINCDFQATMRACMLGRSDGTWINDTLIAGYTRLHKLGLAHSIEVWADGQLVGGLYGVAIGAAFFGESMFHRRRDASKVALVHLVQRLHARDFQLLDCQACTPHLARFGCIELPAKQYLRRLHHAVALSRSFV